ncbi:MAG: hypothetical protein KQI62_14045 [Deltaproteobacteria bacterium]|nr:hypothetical protein [Deltaproteobacteria bacterium]
MEWINENLPMISLAAFLVSLAAFVVVIWEKVIPRYHLNTSINQIAVLRVPGNNIAPLLLEMLTIDICSGTPSPSALNIIAQYPALNKIDKSNKESILRLLVKLSKANKIGYSAPPNIVSSFTHHELYKLPLYVPLIVTNTGNRIANISTLVLVLKKKDAPTEKWLYWAVAEINPSLLIKRGMVPIKDADRFTQGLGMISVLPMKSVRIDPYFVPIMELDGNKIWVKNPEPGTYLVNLKGYGTDGDLVVKSDEVEFNLNEKAIIDAGRGNETLDSLQAVEHFRKALQD